MNNDLKNYNEITLEYLTELLPKILPITFEDLSYSLDRLKEYNIKPHLNDKDKIILVALLLSKHSMNYEDVEYVHNNNKAYLYKLLDLCELEIDNEKEDINDYLEALSRTKYVRDICGVTDDEILSLMKAIKR